MSADDALLWVARLTAVAWALGALELLQVRRSVYSVWTDAAVARDLAAWPRVFSTVLGARSFTVVLLLQLGAALLMLVFGLGPWAAVGLAATVLTAMRWRGSYNGGSDQMSVVLGSALTVASVDPPRLGPLALAYVTAQLILSYGIAGLVKLAEPTWRSGDALRRLRAMPRYAVPPLPGRLMDLAARPLAMAVIALECAAPLVLAGPRVATLVLAVALSFHVANAWALGLNRFLLAWVAAYPAALWASTLG